MLRLNCVAVLKGFLWVVRWAFIFGLAGFYSGNGVNLAFGTLGVNDLAAAAAVVAAYEYVMIKFYKNYSQGSVYVLYQFFRLRTLVLTFTKLDYKIRPMCTYIHSADALAHMQSLQENVDLETQISLFHLNL